MCAVVSHVDLFAIVLPCSRRSLDLQLTAYTQTNDSLPDTGFLFGVLFDLFDSDGGGITFLQNGLHGVTSQKIIQLKPRPDTC
jgi:hypothetical protein